VVVVVVVVVAAVSVTVKIAVTAAVYPLVPLTTLAISATSPSHSVSRQTLNLVPYFAALSYFPQNGPFALLRSSSPCGSLRFQSSAYFSMDSPSFFRV
jgi:hypothetical protein